MDIQSYVSTLPLVQSIRLMHRAHRRIFERLGGPYDYPTAIACGYGQLIEVIRAVQRDFAMRPAGEQDAAINRWDGRIAK